MSRITISMSEVDEERLNSFKGYLQAEGMEAYETNSQVLHLAIKIVTQLFVEPWGNDQKNTYGLMQNVYHEALSENNELSVVSNDNLLKDVDKIYIAILNIFKFMIGDENGAWLGQMDHYDNQKGITVLIDNEIKKLISNNVKSSLSEQNNKF